MERVLPTPSLDDPLIELFELGNCSTEIWRKALHIISKRMESGELSDHMLVRIVATLAKSTAPFEAPPSAAAPVVICYSCFQWQAVRLRFCGRTKPITLENQGESVESVMGRRSRAREE